ncbi:hypothetical protein [Amycolatopsis thailandensis]|uniref:hypothetical protein n=1 Tax=Amycolatopsis thailandensis TaxID=589330 RepID=UPI00363DE4F4
MNGIASSMDRRVTISGGERVVLQALAHKTTFGMTFREIASLVRLEDRDVYGILTSLHRKRFTAKHTFVKRQGIAVVLHLSTPAGRERLMSSLELEYKDLVHTMGAVKDMA